MDNYEKMQEAARLRFLQYDFEELLQRPSVKAIPTGLEFLFLGAVCQVSRQTGKVTFPQRKDSRGTVLESLCVYDWLCDSRKDAKASEEYCPVSSLSRVYVSGNGLQLDGNSLADEIEKNPAAFLKACKALGGRETQGADLAALIPAFPDFSVLLHFYFGDEEFAPRLIFLWDSHILQFLRYETVYYLAGCLINRLSVYIQPLGLI